MGQDSKIEWTDHTFNPWRGCTKVAPGCEHCYAEKGAKRNPGVLGIWGPKGTRVVASEEMWGEPVKWDKKADAKGIRAKVFCASLADVFEAWNGTMSAPDGRVWCKPYLDRESQPENWELSDPEVMQRDPQGWRLVTLDDVRRRLFRLIDDTPHLDWQLVTKRPENIRRMWPAHLPSSKEGIARYWETLGDRLTPASDDDAWRGNVWLGTSVSDQASADKQLPELERCRDLTPVLFASAEPLLGRIDLRGSGDQFISWTCGHRDGLAFVGDFYPDRQGNPEDMDGPGWATCCRTCGCEESRHVLDWVICGGESGPKARPMHPQWAQSMRDQCQAFHVPFFFKQWGEWLPYTGEHDGTVVKAAQVSALSGEYATRETRLPSSGELIRVGKEAAGRLLDGLTWNQFPEPAAALTS